MIRISDKLQLLGSTFVSQGLRILTTLVLARLLTPKDYGMVVLIGATAGLIGLGDFGVGRALVQIRDVPEQTVTHTALVLTIAFGLLYALIHIACGSYLAFAYSDPRFFYLSVIIAVTALASVIYTFQIACLSRSLKFNQESRQNLIFAIAQAATGIALALAGYGVYALVLMALVAQLIANLVILKSQPLVWPSHFSLAAGRRFLSFGWKVTLSSYVGNAQVSLLNLIVAHYVGTYGLGIFGRATQIRDLVGNNIVSSFDHLLFPSLANMRNDVERMQYIFLRGVAGIALLTSLGGALLYVNSVDLVKLMLGTQWGAVPVLLSTLSLALFVGGLELPSTSLSLALGKPFVWFRFTLGSLILTIPVAFLAGRWGLNALCGALVITQAIYVLGFMLWALRELQVPLSKALPHLLPITLSAVLSLLAMLAVRHLLSIGYTTTLRLFVTSGVGIGLYGGLIWFLDRKTIVQLRSLIQLRADTELPLPG